MTKYLTILTDPSSSALFVPLFLVVSTLGAVAISIAIKNINEAKFSAVRNEKKIEIISAYRRKSEDLLFDHIGDLASAFLISKATKEEKEKVFNLNIERKQKLAQIREAENQALKEVDKTVVDPLIPPLLWEKLK